MQLMPNNKACTIQSHRVSFLSSSLKASFAIAIFKSLFLLAYMVKLVYINACMVPYWPCLCISSLNGPTPIVFCIAIVRPYIWLILETKFGLYDEVAHLELQDKVRKLINDLPCYYVQAKFKLINCVPVCSIVSQAYAIKIKVVNK